MLRLPLPVRPEPRQPAGPGGAGSARGCRGLGVPAGGAWPLHGLSESPRPSGTSRAASKRLRSGTPGPGAASPAPERTAVPRVHEEQTRENPRLSDGGPRQTRCVRAPRAPPAPARERPRPGEREQGPSRRTRGRERRRESSRRPPPRTRPRAAAKPRPGLTQPYRRSVPKRSLAAAAASPSPPPPRSAMAATVARTRPAPRGPRRPPLAVPPARQRALGRAHAAIGRRARRL